MGRKTNPKIEVLERANGGRSYRVRYAPHGRRTSETFDTFAEAETFRQVVINDGAELAFAMRERRDQNSPDYVPTLAEVFERHIEELTGVQQRTKQDYRAEAARTWLPIMGKYPVDAITRAMVARWLNSEEGYRAPKTIKNAQGVLSAAFEYAIREQYIAVNPAKGHRLTRMGEEDLEDIRFLTHAEFATLLRHTPDHYRPLILTLFGTGLRFGEVTALKKRDLDLDAGFESGDAWEPSPLLRVVRAWKKAPTGQKPTMGPPKSKASRRTVPLPAEVAAVLERLVEGRSDDSLIFTTTTGVPISHQNFHGRIWWQMTVRAMVCDGCFTELIQQGCRCFMAKYVGCSLHPRTVAGERPAPKPCGHAGTVSPRPRIHDARHTHASWLIAEGVRLEVVQERLGHEDYLTTRRLYVHLLPEAHREAGRAANAAFAHLALSPAVAAVVAPGLAELPQGLADR